MKKNLITWLLSLTLVLTLCVSVLAVPASASGRLDPAGPSKEELAQKWKEVTYATERYVTEPSVSAPYAAGELSESFLLSGITYLNYVRFAANLPAVQLQDSLNEDAQHGAVLLAAIDTLTHYPSQPADMDDDFYSRGYSATTSSNISARYGYAPLGSLQSAVFGCMADNSSVSNLACMGHRRWLLNPKLLNVGFGYAESESGWSYIVTKVFDRSGETFDYDNVAWPAAGNFPTNLFDTRTPWSITLNPSKYQKPSLDQVKVTITREADGKTWSFDGSTGAAESASKAYLEVNNQGYGVSNCIIFNPGSDNIDTYNGVFTVDISGIFYTNGTAATLQYQVDFFDVEKVCPDHSYDAVVTPPTCTEQGYTTYTCDSCGDSYVDNYVPATGHTYEDGNCKNCGQKLDVSGTCGQGSWRIYGGELTISGNGAMQDYTDKTQMPWYGYFDQITSVVIGDGITRIGDYAFYGMPRLQSITIAESVTVIGNYAFKNCPVLDGVKLPSGLTKLGESAFYACTGLTSIDIPASLWTIQPYTFKNCTALSDVTFHEGNLQKISDGAFYNTGLTSVILPDCLDILDVYVFKNCTKLTSIKLSASLTQIREAVLYGTAIREIVIPEGVTVIQPYAFKNCVNLTTVSLPGTLTSVDEAAFYACSSLTGITLPDKVTTIGDYAFRKCTGLTAVTFSSDLLRIGESSFYGCTGITSLHIPEGVTVIQAYAFKGCTKLANLSLPGTLTTIGDSAFHTCTSLKTIVIPAKVTGIGAYCFSGSYNLWKITFLGDAPAIGNYAFKGLAATAYYPGGNSTWTSAVRQNYGGTITWKAN